MGDLLAFRMPRELDEEYREGMLVRLAEKPLASLWALT
jgi:hypothetical protein